MCKKKWVCEYCTYSNWPSSMKCTMCRGNKPARLCGSENIFNAAVNITNNQRGKHIVNGLKNWQMWSVLFLIHCIRSDCKRCRFDLRLIRIWYLYVTQPIGRFSNIISKTKYQRVQLLWEQWNLKYQQAFLCFTMNLYSRFDHYNWNENQIYLSSSPHPWIFYVDIYKLNDRRRHERHSPSLSPSLSSSGPRHLSLPDTDHTGIKSIHQLIN